MTDDTTVPWWERYPTPLAVGMEKPTRRYVRKEELVASFAFEVWLPSWLLKDLTRVRYVLLDWPDSPADQYIAGYKGRRGRDLMVRGYPRLSRETRIRTAQGSEPWALGNAEALRGDVFEHPR